MARWRNHLLFNFSLSLFLTSISTKISIVSVLIISLFSHLNDQLDSLIGKIIYRDPQKHRLVFHDLFFLFFLFLSAFLIDYFYLNQKLKMNLFSYPLTSISLSLIFHSLLDSFSKSGVSFRVFFFKKKRIRFNLYTTYRLSEIVFVYSVSIVFVILSLIFLYVKNESFKAFVFDFFRSF